MNAYRTTPEEFKKSIDSDNKAHYFVPLESIGTPTELASLGSDGLNSCLADDHVENGYLLANMNYEFAIENGIMGIKVIADASDYNEEQIMKTLENDLLTIKDVTEEDAKKIVGIIQGDINPEEVSEKAANYVRSCHCRPQEYLIKLYAINEILHTCGVESTGKFYYCNAGETYANTVMYRYGFWVSSLGDEL